MSRFVPLAGAAVALLALSACATGPDVEGTEQMLAAAGFAQYPATTPQLQNALALLPPHRVVQRPPDHANAPVTYAYADPTLCHCLWIGNAQNYQYFQHLAVQQRIAEEYQQAALMNEDAALDWSTLPPAPAVVVVHHR